MDPNFIQSVNQLIDKQDTTIAMLQAVVRAIYDNAGIGGQGGTSGGGNVSTTSTNISIPIPLPVILSGGVFDVQITNQPLTVNALQSGTWNVGITGQPIGVNVQNTPTVQAQQSGTWNVGIAGQPIGVNVQNTPTVQAQQSGTWNVGITGQPIGVNVLNTPTVLAQQSGTWNVNLTGQPIQITFSQPTYKYAVISANTAGDTPVVAAVSNKKIRVVAFAIVAAGTVNVKFRRGSTDITGTMRLVEAGGIAHAFEGGLFETDVNQALNINLSSPPAQVGGYVVYQEV